MLHQEKKRKTKTKIYLCNANGCIVAMFSKEKNQPVQKTKEKNQCGSQCKSLQQKRKKNNQLVEKKNNE